MKEWINQHVPNSKGSLIMIGVILVIITAFMPAAIVVTGVLGFIVTLGICASFLSTKEDRTIAKVAEEAGWKPYDDKGFTLIELAIVIGVVCLCAMIPFGAWLWILGGVALYLLSALGTFVFLGPKLKYAQQAKDAGWKTNETYETGDKVTHNGQDGTVIAPASFPTRAHIEKDAPPSQD